MRLPRPRSRLRLRPHLIAVAVAAALFLIALLCTSSAGVQAVRDAIEAKTGAGSTASVQECRAVLPGLVYCRYDLRRRRPTGPKEGGTLYESYYLWFGPGCRRLVHAALAMYRPEPTFPGRVRSR